jgi:hypothetical protein
MKSCTVPGARLILLALLLCTAPLHAQTTWYVDDDAPGDPGPGDTSVSDPLEDGSENHPFDAIQEGIDAAINGDTVLVADGTYSGGGNWDMDFHGKAITVASANGPEACIIDGLGEWGVEEHLAFWFESGEGPDSVLRGLTITNFVSDSVAGIYCGSSPTIIGNVIHSNEGFDLGGAMFVGGDPLIIGNVISNNIGEYAGGIMVYGTAWPLIFNNLVFGNTSYGMGYGQSGAIYCFCDFYGQCRAVIVGCTIADNWGGGYATGIYANEEAIVTVRDSIVWGNFADEIYAFNGSVAHCDVEGGFPGTNNIDLDPLFVSGPGGDYHLSQIAAGQAVTSPCVDWGSEQAAYLCASSPTGVVCMDDVSTRTDGFGDTGWADLGYHSPAGSIVSASFVCVPDSGVLPFQSTMFVELENRHPEIARRIAGKINVKLAGGQGYTNWRAGYTNVGAGSSDLISWAQNIPAIGSLVGNNLFSLVAEDVTPAPYNSPPYPPAGDTATATCTVAGVAP